MCNEDFRIAYGYGNEGINMHRFDSNYFNIYMHRTYRKFLNRKYYKY